MNFIWKQFFWCMIKNQTFRILSHLEENCFRRRRLTLNKKVKKKNF